MLKPSIWVLDAEVHNKMNVVLVYLPLAAEGAMRGYDCRETQSLLKYIGHRSKKAEVNNNKENEISDLTSMANSSMSRTLKEELGLIYLCLRKPQTTCNSKGCVHSIRTFPPL